MKKIKKLNYKNYTSFDIQKKLMKEYLQVVIAQEDWHGVSDIANDIRELEARHDKKYKSK